MDIDALPESSILSQKPSEWLHLLFQVIYFLVTISNYSFRRMRFQNLDEKKQWA